MFSRYGTVPATDRRTKGWTHRASIASLGNNDTALAYYNFDVHQLILINFGKNVAKKVSGQTVLYFPTSPN